jgi:DNA-binding SARP family transcriptional activator/pimeloyl-ACP methyl ester carboxylesterase
MGEHASAITAQLFGSLRITVGDRTLAARDLGPLKQQHLLAVLLIDRGRLVTKERLADLVWGERRPRNVSATIETYVSLIRRSLTEAGGAGRRVILTGPGGYRLDADAVRCDLDVFDALLRRAAAAAAPTDRRRALEEAIALSDREVLADAAYAEWAAGPREHYRARRLQALVDLAECCLADGDHRGAVEAATRVLEVEKTHERACRALMLGHDGLGQRSEALHAFASLRSALDETLGVRPAGPTVAVHTDILRRDEAPAASVSPGAGMPSVRYADNGGVRIAYQVVGDGPVDLVFLPSFVTNLAATWDDPTYGGFLSELATMSRLILWDKRGTGLSDPAVDFPTTRQRSDDLAAVLRAAGSERSVIFGVCAGAALAVQFAVDHPERTAGLVLFGGFARMLATEGYPWGWPAEQYEWFLSSLEEAWLGPGDGISRRNPSLLMNPRYRAWFARYVRVAASPYMARRLAEMNAEIDVRDQLEHVRAPALVIVRRDYAWLSAANSEYLARHIAGAELLSLPGVDHDPWVGDTAPVLDAVRGFLAERAAQAGLVSGDRRAPAFAVNT